MSRIDPTDDGPSSASVSANVPVAPARRQNVLFGVMVGAVTALVILYLVEGVQVELAPLPDTLDRSDPAQFGAIPIGHHLVLLASWFAGALAGSLTTQRLTRRQRTGWVPVAMIIIICLLNRIALPMPAWMVAAGIGLPMAAHALAVVIARRWFAVRD